MAIYHLSAKILSRSAGRSAVAAAAYRAGARLRDARTGRLHDYRRKRGVVHTEILLPEGAPPAWLDRAALWNAVEAAEKRKDAQVAREIEIALPRELPRAEAIRLARDFVRQEFVARGMVADFAVHWGQSAAGEAQPHAHVLLTLRRAGPDGFGPKAREWNETDLLLRRWRERWAGLVNARLAEAGHDVRIDHRSHAEQGIALTPQTKIGAAARRMAAAGQAPERVALHRAIARDNGEKIIASPALALAAITREQSTFTRRDLARLLHRHTDGAAQFARTLAVVEASPELVRLGRDGRGQERFTTREMLALEQDLAATARRLAGQAGHPALTPERVRVLAQAAGLGDEQGAALVHITGAQDLAAVVGYAGTGKSTMLGAARAVWEGAGYRVRGAALSGIAAEGLQQGAGIPSRTIASLLHRWGRGRERLTARDVLVIDEAGMIGSRQMHALLAAVRAAGAKIVLVGDPEQLQPIEPGAPFRVLAERVGAASIATVRRQREVWQRQATQELATARTAQALARYRAAGMVHRHATLDEAKAALIAAWDTARQAAPEATQIILAHRRADVRDLNEMARALRRRAGELGADVELPTEQGARLFAQGDRLYFLRNERSLGVKNGTLGTITRISGRGAGARLAVRLDDGREVEFDLKDYRHLDHGYAATVHKSQGVTVDQAHVLASRGMDRHTTYVALSRHRDALTLHWSADEMGDQTGMVAALARERRNDSALDYGEAEGPVTGPAQAYAARRGLVPESAIVVRHQPPRPPAPDANPATLRHHLDALEAAASAHRRLAAAWDGSAEHEKALAALITRSAAAARAIAAAPGMTAVLATTRPALARQVTALAATPVAKMLERARCVMPHRVQKPNPQPRPM